MPLIELPVPDAQGAIVQAVADVGEASAEILRNLPSLPPACIDRHTFEVAAEALSSLLATLIDLVERTDEDDIQLRGALQRWLP